VKPETIGNTYGENGEKKTSRVRVRIYYLKLRLQNEFFGEFEYDRRRTYDRVRLSEYSLTRYSRHRQYHSAD